MRGRREIGIIRGLSVIGSSAFLALASAGGAVAHPQSVVPSAGIEADHLALAALICSYEPCDDPDELAATIDEVLASWPDADDVAEALFGDEDDEDEADEQTQAPDEAEADDDDQGASHEAEAEADDQDEDHDRDEADDDSHEDEADDDSHDEDSHEDESDDESEHDDSHEDESDDD